MAILSDRGGGSILREIDGRQEIWEGREGDADQKGSAETDDTLVAHIYIHTRTSMHVCGDVCVCVFAISLSSVMKSRERWQG